MITLTRRDLLKGAGALVVSFAVPGAAVTALGQPTNGKPALMPDELDSWIAVKADGGVTAFFGKMDMGQGVDVAIGQIVADELDGFWLRHAGGPRIEVKPLKDGLSMIAAGDIDDLGTRRLELALPAFRAWPIPDPDRHDWAAWETLLGSTRAPPDEPAMAAMRFRTDGYGTVSSGLIALPAREEVDRRPVFRFAEWLPEATPWRDVMTGSRQGSQT